MAVRSEKDVVHDLISSVNHALGGAWQMVHQRGDVRWVDIRNSLQGIKDGVITFAVAPLYRGFKNDN